MSRKPNPALKDFILSHVEENPDSVSALAVEQFNLSRTTVNRYMQKLVSEGLLSEDGNTKAKRYALKPIVSTNIQLQVDYLWTEDDVWRNHISPLMKEVRKTVVDLCHYGLTEMVNNALDHASSPTLTVIYEQNYRTITMTVADEGMGIFKKLQKDFNLSDPRTALLELSKGRLTSDKRRHAGEGIYFTSRMFDEFSLSSENLNYTRKRDEAEDWSVQTNDRTADQKGTIVRMSIRLDADWTMQDVFDAYQGDNLRFRKTQVPVLLAQYPGEELVSRSQAKRLLARFDKFSEVFLDFKAVEQIGQPFADEVFRVYRNDHPNVRIVVSGANAFIKRMISYVSEGEFVVEEGE